MDSSFLSVFDLINNKKKKRIHRIYLRTLDWSLFQLENILKNIIFFFFAFKSRRKLVKYLCFLLPSALSSCSILPRSPSIVRRTTETISWNRVWAGTMTNPSCKIRCGHSSRATTQCTGKNLLLNARPRTSTHKSNKWIFAHFFCLV